ncbi:MAG: T9SS type A sorting domain-containing protein [Sphingobacteriaceae bacterium]|nr:MAG: T9SS type A sorting domain-containing protein [Sphingobacteriaceae bacterium]
MRKLYLFVLMASLNMIAFAQESPHHHSVAERSSGQSGTGSNIDVVYHRAWWRINPDSAKAIRGIVTTYFKTTTPNVSSITFDLRQSAFNNANLVVTYHGTTCTRTVSAANVLTITLPSTIAATNTLDSVVIRYYGVPPGVDGAAEGFQLAQTPASQNYIYTLSESYEDRDWWPCKADMQDKIDSMDIIVNTPWSGADTFWVATNGRLLDSTIAGGSRTFTFKNTYPMASYLVCLSVARYNRYYRGTVNQGGVQVPIVYNLFRGKTATQYNTILTSMDYMTTLLTEFSNKFGYYPFRRDKHGFYEGLAGAGGMEHQSFSAIATSSLNSRTTLAHELLHQWFGNKVTFATWADLWLAEGFGRYAQVLLGELVPAAGVDPAAQLTSIRGVARGNTTTPARITSFTTSNQVWGGSNISAVYDRGCMALSMLRALVGDDKFFEACRNYLDSANGSGFKSATTDSLKNNFNRVLGTDLTPFFNDFVLGTGHPTYSIMWQTNPGGGIYVGIGSQNRTSGSNVAYFNSPIVLRVQGSGGKDTTIVFYDLTNGNFTTGNLAKAGNGIQAPVAGNRLFFPLSFVPTTVTFDPGNKTLGGGTTIQVSTLDLKVLSFNVQKNNGSNEAYLTLDGNSTNTAVILERSANGTHYTELGTMADLTPATIEKRYHLQDAYPLAGDNYYRAKYKNAAGVYVYSKVVIISEDATGGFKLLNNPVGNTIKLRNPAGRNAANAVLTFYDIAGKQILKYESKIAGNITEVKLPFLSKGTYVLEIKYADAVQAIRINKN